MCFTSIFCDLFPILNFNDLNPIAEILTHSQLSGCKIQCFSFWFNMEASFIPLNTEWFCYIQGGWHNPRSKVVQDTHSKSESNRCCVVHHFFSFTLSVMLSRTTAYIRVWCLPDATLMCAPSASVMKPAAGWNYIYRKCG